MAAKEKPPQPADELAYEQFESEKAGRLGIDPSDGITEYEGYVLARAATIWSQDDPGIDLSIDEALFCRSYAIDRNDVAALRRLGHDASNAVLKSRAKKLLAIPRVQECIEELAKRTAAALDVSREKITAALANIAFFDPRKVMEFDQYGVRLLNSRFWSANDAAALKKIKMGANGIELELYDRQAALIALDKIIAGAPAGETDLQQFVREGQAKFAQRMYQYLERTHVPVPGDPNFVDPLALPASEQVIEHDQPD